MKENMPEFTGVGENDDVVDIDMYSRTTKTSHKKLQEIWKDLELSEEAQEQQLSDITERALGVWNGAVEHAEQHRQGIRKRIEEAAAEMKTIAELLGEINAIEDTSSSVASLLMSPGKNLKRQFDEVMGELEGWRRKKAARMKEHDELQDQINAICECLGMPLAPKKKVKNSITLSNMEILKLELERMRGEKVRRERKLEAALSKLRKICIEVGADDGEVAASVHPSLRNHHEGMRGHYYYAAPTSDHEASATAPTQPAITDSVFASLDARLEEMAAVKQEREVALGELKEVLLSMWNSVGITDEDENRVFFERMMASPARLHTHSHEKCKEEISRLEVEQAKTMRTIIQRNVLEVAQLSEATGLPAPELSAILAGSESEGTVAEALHNLNVMLAQLKAIVSTREPVLKLIKDVEENFKEVIWLFQHQQDNMFNNRGRDANRLLQRSIKAEDKKKKLPKLIAKLRTTLAEWELANGGKAFVLGAVVYATDVLDVIELELNEISNIKPRKPTANKRPKTAGGKPPLEHQPVLAAPQKALAMIARAHDVSAIASDRPQTAPSTNGGDATCSGLPPTSVAPMRAGGTRNPLQELVNEVANAPGPTSRPRRQTSLSAGRYASASDLALLQVDDSVNLGSVQPSPAVKVAEEPPAGASGENVDEHHEVA